MSHYTIGWSFDEVPLKDESEPAAFLIATHRDCFPNEAEAQASGFSQQPS